MVLIEITNPDAGASELREWSVVELQGNLEKVAGAEALSFDGLDVGKLKFQTDKPVLTIGPHILEGEVKKLPHPLLVLMRDDGSLVTSPGEEGVAAGEPLPAAGAGTGYTVAGLVRQKLLFKNRPKMGLGIRNSNR